jgi:hypothetical protein
MKTTMRHAVLPTILLGGMLWIPGCSTPPTSLGVTSKSNRIVLCVRSPVPTPVQCLWRQDGSRCEHRNTTPFRLVLPGDKVDALTFATPAGAGDVVVELRPPDGKATRFAVGRGSRGLRLARNGQQWDAQTF